jgi:hypothetical protein
MRWVPEFIIDGTKILSMRVGSLNFIDSLNVLPMSLKSMPKSFDLTCKVLTPIISTGPRIYTVGPHPEPKYYGVNFISGNERARFLEWYEE